MRSTKIMATVADDRCTPAFVQMLRDAGMDSVRINSAHVTPESIELIVGIIHAVAPEVKILMDTKGPEIRTTSLCDDRGEGLPVVEGSRWRIGSSATVLTREGMIYVAVEGIHRYLTPGMMVLVDDGDLEFRVDEVTDDCVMTTAIRTGTLGSRKTVAIPGVELPPLPAVSERDRVNIAAARRAGIDMIAHSFVRDAADVRALRAELEGSDIKVYSKIECVQAVENMEEILRESDGLLVARGDLGTAVPLQQLPEIQLRILRLCRLAGKGSIVSTQMLHSMIEKPSPTRAEVSDIALAVMEGADTLLLTGETAQGRYPCEAVEMMRLTIEAAENASLRCII
ncbi:MAG: pyruvate kinase [Muribaculaceae bacterium]|nr:pyruvate kinase [Muribaculaceae bacterium]